MAAPGSEKYLIVNADDLGASDGINRGIFEASERGIVTSASLMVGATAADRAAAGLPAHSSLSVGLHATLTEAGRRWRIEPRDCAAELDRQLARFERLAGRPPTHLDSHHHVHRDARVWEYFLAFAQAHELPLRDHSPIRYLPGFYGRRGAEPCPERVSVSGLLKMLKTEVGVGVSELGCHPGYLDPDFRSSYREEREVELRTLCDPRVRDGLSELGIELINFADTPTLGLRDPSFREPAG